MLAAVNEEFENARNGKLEIARMLVEAGADLNIVNKVRFLVYIALT